MLYNYGRRPSPQALHLHHQAPPVVGKALVPRLKGLAIAKKKTVKTIKTTRAFQAAQEVRTVWDDDEANVLLENGWTLADAGRAHTDSSGFNAKPVYILIRSDKD